MTFTITVTNSEGKPQPNVTLQIKPSDEVKTFKTNAEGKATIEVDMTTPKYVSLDVSLLKVPNINHFYFQQTNQMLLPSLILMMILPLTSKPANKYGSSYKYLIMITNNWQEQNLFLLQQMPKPRQTLMEKLS